MANTQMPFGLLPVRHMFGGVIRSNRYTIADQYSTSLFQGDPVVCTGTGKNVGIATAGGSGTVTGVFNGCEYVDAAGDTKFSKYWPASTVTKAGSSVFAWVFDDPFILYAIQSGATGVALADIRLLTDLVSGAGSTITGQSAWSCAGLAGAENQLKVYELADFTFPGGVANAYGAYAVVHVLLGKPELIATAPVEL
jgi:hypothetical protein